MSAPIEFFWARVNKTDQSGCWLWTGNKGKAPNNYGRIEVNGQRKRSHRFAYELLKGPIPEGLGVLHKCDNPPCVNPDHLFLGTQQDNTDDSVAKGRKFDVGSVRHLANQAQRAKTHCPHGHPYSGANLYISPKGSRICRTCTSARTVVCQRARIARRKDCK